MIPTPVRFCEARSVPGGPVAPRSSPASGAAVRAVSVAIPVLVFAFALPGCAGSTARDGAPPSSRDQGDLVAEFDEYWSRFDSLYPYFPYKGMDWDAQRERFRPRVAALETRGELIALLQEMVAPLRDIHIWFVDPEGRQRRTYFPGHFVNWDRELWTKNVGRMDWVQVAPDLGYGRIEGVPYITIGAWNPNNFTPEDFEKALRPFRGESHLILDVRPNGGGNDGLAMEVAGRFTRERVLAATYRFRGGPGHGDLGPPRERFLEPSGEWRFEGEVLLLIGRGCFSSNETFISAMGELPNVTLVGDTTGGASGNPAFFDLGGGWTFSVPRWIAYTPTGEIVEWNGIAPDVHVPATPEDFAGARDPVLAYAVERVLRR